jgi:HlyD family secretion protein
MNPAKIARALVIAASAAAAMLWLAWWGLPHGPSRPPAYEVDVTRGPLVVRLVESGTLRAASAVTYRSPLEGREVEVTFLAPEGLHVKAGDLIAKVDSTPVARELERASQTLDQARLELRIIEGELQQAESALRAAGDEGGDSPETEEAAAALQLAERRLERARRAVEELTPLLKAGYVTRDELERATLEVEQQEAAVRVARRRVETQRQLVEPQGRQRARLQAAQQAARRQFAAQRVGDLEAQLAQFRDAMDRCSIFAEAPGLLVYEENVSASPRRKVRVGDRVTPSNGLITVTEVERMVVDTSVREVDVHKVKVGLPATIRLDAFPGEQLAGTVEFVGALARSSFDRPYEDKRFDVRVAVAASRLALRPDMTARVDITIAERQNVTLLPVNAISVRDGRMEVRVIAGGAEETRPVTLGGTDGLHYEVLAGVEAGDRVRLPTVPPR